MRNSTKTWGLCTDRVMHTPSWCFANLVFVVNVVVVAEFVKVCRIRFSIWKSFIGFYICCYPITTILTCLFSVRVRISWKKLCWMRVWRRRWHLVSPTLYIIIVYRVNLNKLSRNFAGAIRATTTNCRVSFIDLYLVFPTNFRIVFLPHTNTVILLEPYCGTITEPGLPVLQPGTMTGRLSKAF